MSTVMLAGSRSVSNLGAPVREKVQDVISQGVAIVVGDANGADKAFQKFLVTRGYDKVTVFCAGDHCRNNLGNWRVVSVPTGSKRLDFEHYTRKDERMVDEADSGIFLWDGKSRGTINSLRMLLRRGRSAAVYHAPKRTFLSVNNEGDLEDALDKLRPGAPRLHRIRSKKGKANSIVQGTLFD